MNRGKFSHKDKNNFIKDKKSFRFELFIFFAGIFIILILFFINQNPSFTGRVIFKEDDSIYPQEDYIELLIKTSDNIPSKKPREEWTEENFLEERIGGAKQGYVINVKPEGWVWGDYELKPNRFAIVKIPKSDWNESWLEPEYDSQGNIKTMRKYRLPLESFLNDSELNNLRNIPYNDNSYREPIIKTINNIEDKIVLVDWENRPEDLFLHGSSGTFTICPSGCNYSSLANWESGEQSDLTGTGPCIANITEGFEDTSALQIYTWTTTSSDYIKIITAPVARHNGKWDNSAYMLNVTDANAITIQESFVYLEGLQIRVSLDTADRIFITGPGGIDAGSHIDISQCIIQGHEESVLDPDGVQFWDTDANVYFYNNIVANIGSSIVSYGFDCGAQCWIFSSTFYNNGRGIRTTAAGTLYVNNTLSSNHSNADFYNGDGTDALDYCASSDGTATYTGGIGNRINQVFKFVDESITDLHLDPLDTSALDLGVDLSANVDISFSNDIDGETRSGTWDIGADEVLAGDLTDPHTFLGNNPVDTYNSSLQSITFDLKCSDNSGVDVLKLYGNWTGSWTANQTNSTLVNDTWWNVTVNNIPEGIYTWAGWCNDTSNNVNWSVNRTFRIDFTAPVINLPVYTNATAKISSNNLIYNISVFDSGVGSQFCSINVEGANAGNVTVTVSNGWCNGTYALTGASDGNQTIFVYANDTLGNLNLNNNYVVWIDDTNPLISHNFPLNGSSFRYAPFINGTCSDVGTGIDNIWVNLSEYSGLDSSPPYNFTNTSSLSEGNYIAKIGCNDSLNNTIFERFYFTFDKTNPLATIISPVDGTTYTTSSISFNIMTNENSNCNYSIDGGATNYSLSANSTGTGHTASKSLSNANYVVNFYCSDLALNMNNTENVSFNVNVVSTPKTSTSSGGGGGGIIHPKKATFKTDIESYEKSLNSETVDFGRVTITNPDKSEKEYNIDTQNLEEVISFEEDKIILSGGESKILEFKINPLKEPGLYVGKIILTSGLERKEIPVSLNIRSGKNLFDISVFIPDNKKIISSGSILSSQINLLEMGLKENIDVTLHYVIRDFTGRIYLDESETLAVYDQKEVSKDFNTKDLFPGDYVLGVELTYPDGVAVASSHFKVQGEIFDYDLNKIIIFAIIIVSVLTFVIIVFTIRRYKILHKKLRKHKIRNI